ncbi:alpha/beta hydrolase [Siphonobacter sp. SORGH_AS_1065]|uniref:alpha/beta hydrolase n=1 Tax=Siphonobacter sp. SORGH_AS_1065 TaxID=3041795 RepID=UPI00277E384D|nr:alpha/beta fold hydrolase [Siphonobacter sp. SORGH_AS_1065]MDQ1088193.1 alpha-beta hydrolase superfamily lysophospholipase [Siphonobacter sp. SORGH_AS_1065]
MKKTLRFLGWFLLVLFLFFNVLMAFQAYRFTYFYEPQEAVFRRPEQMSAGEKISAALFGFRAPKRPVKEKPDFPYQTVRLKNTAQQTLVGWVSPARGKSKGTVILWHGHGSNKSRVLAEARYFHESGYQTVLFDFRAHGQSEGNVCTIGYKETDDLRTVYNWVKARGESNIILWGMSMGAATILKAVPEYALKPKKVIIECPFGTLEEAIKGRLRSLHIPVQPITSLLLFYGSLERDMDGAAYQPSTYAKQFDMPVLLQWGRNDPRVSQAETDRIFKNLGSTNKKLVIYEESGHQSFCRHETDKWKKEVTEFLNQ